MSAESSLDKTNAADFRQFLQSELIRRTKLNPRFSLRAFARFLKVQSGFLSKLLLGQRRITPATIERFGLKLGLNLRQIEEYKRIASGQAREDGQGAFQQIAYDSFQMISDWYHFAILELASIEQFNPSPRWIAQKLGITVTEARDATERLIRLGYVVVDAKGRWRVTEGHTTTLGSAKTTIALRQMQKQILERAVLALDTVPIEKRDQSTMTMAIDSSRLAEAKNRVKKFRRDLCSYLESGKKKDSVYQLSISLYPVTIDDGTEGESSI